MMLIDSIIKNEAIRNKQMLDEYEDIMRELPRGSLICRKNGYYYLKYRKDGKVYDEYIGKDPGVISDIKEKIERRKHCEDMISALKQEQKTINKILGGLK